MNRNFHIFASLLLLLFFTTACKEEEKQVLPLGDLGKITHYDSFLWSDAHTDTIAHSLVLDFSQDAVDDPDCFAALGFMYDAKDNARSYDKLVVLVGNQPAVDNCIVVKSTDKEVPFALTFDDGAESGQYFGTVRLNRHKLDRIEDIEVSPDRSVDFMRWSLEYENVWNPLATLFFWIGIFILAALLIWFLALKRYFYPTFKLSRLTFEGPGTYYASKKIRQYRKVVLSSKRKSQNILSSLFTGKILFIRDDFWTPELVIEPGRRKTARLRATSEWTVTPSSTLERDMTYKIENLVSKQTSVLTVS